MEKNLTAKKSCIKMQVVAKSLSTGVQEGRVFLLHTAASHPKGLNYCFQAQSKSKTVVFASYERHLDNVTTFHMFSILRTRWKALLSVISVITCCTGLHVPSSRMHTKRPVSEFQSKVIGTILQIYCVYCMIVRRHKECSRRWHGQWKIVTLHILGSMSQYIFAFEN